MLGTRAARSLKNVLEGGCLLLVYAISLVYWRLQALRASNGTPRIPALRSAYLSALLYLTLFIVGAAPALYLGWDHAGAFNTPDETAASLAARTFAQDGRLYIEDDVSKTHPGHLGGPRGFIQHNGRSVPFYPLGHPLVLGLAHEAFSGAAPLVLAIIPGLLVLTLALLMRVLAPGSPPYLGFIFLGVVPLWYWASRVYMDLALAFLFIALGILCFTLALRRGSLWWLLGGSCAFGLAALARLSEAPLLLLVAMAFVIAAVRRNPTNSLWASSRILAVYAAGQIAFFLVPLGVLNWWTYGSPTDIGYVLFYEKFHPDLVPSEGSPVGEVVGFLQAAFFPNPMSLEVLKNGVFYQMVLLVPIILALGLGGLWLSRKALLGTFGYAGVLLLAATLSYVLVSRTNPGTHGALAEDPFVLASLVRYWMPVYLALGIGAAYALSHAPRPVSVALILGLVGVSAFQVWISSPEAVLRLRNVVNDRALGYEQVLQENTEPEAIVFAVGRIDKFVAPFRRTVGVWSPSPGLNEVKHLAQSAISMRQLGNPVYFMFNSGISNHDSSVDYVNKSLQEHSLHLRRLAPHNQSVGLWRVERQPPPLAMEPVAQNTYLTNTLAPRGNFAISIDKDGSPVNRISNSSFESSLHGWSGPGFGEFLRRSNQEAHLGEFSMRLELPPDAGAGYLVRRTQSIRVPDSGNEDWVAMARVKAAQLSNARAELRVFLRDRSGNVVRREGVFVAESSDEFVTVGLAGNISQRNIETIELQLNLRSLQHGGSGVVYWDDPELKSGPFRVEQQCEAEPSWCAWKGVSHQTRVWDGSIELIKVRAGDGDEVYLNGPFRANDQIVFREDGIYLDRKAEPSETRLASFTRPEPDSLLALVVTALNEPSMRMVRTN